MYIRLIAALMQAVCTLFVRINPGSMGQRIDIGAFCFLCYLHPLYRCNRCAVRNLWNLHDSNGCPELRHSKSEDVQCQPRLCSSIVAQQHYHSNYHED